MASRPDPDGRTDLETFGERLFLVRRRRGMGQAELARLAGISVAALSKYERGLRDPQGVVIAALAVALGVSADYLLGLRHNPDPHRP